VIVMIIFGHAKWVLLINLMGYPADDE